MKPTLLQRSLSLGLVTVFLASQVWATCGGGGGGGMGGMSGGGGGQAQQVYMVPWKLVKAEDAPMTVESCGFSRRPCSKMSRTTSA